MPLTEADIRTKLSLADIFPCGGRRIRLLFLLPESLWRPLQASWWRGKEVCVIGGDEDGNYVLRHCDGSVRLWDHAQRTDEILAPSVREFLRALIGEHS